MIGGTCFQDATAGVNAWGIRVGFKGDIAAQHQLNLVWRYAVFGNLVERLNKGHGLLGAGFGPLDPKLLKPPCHFDL